MLYAFAFAIAVLQAQPSRASGPLHSPRVRMVLNRQLAKDPDYWEAIDGSTGIPLVRLNASEEFGPSVVGSKGEFVSFCSNEDLDHQRAWVVICWRGKVTARGIRQDIQSVVSIPGTQKFLAVSELGGIYSFSLRTPWRLTRLMKAPYKKSDKITTYLVPSHASPGQLLLAHTLLGWGDSADSFVDFYSVSGSRPSLRKLYRTPTSRNPFVFPSRFANTVYLANSLGSFQMFHTGTMSLDQKLGWTPGNMQELCPPRRSIFVLELEEKLHEYKEVAPGKWKENTELSKAGLGNPRQIETDSSGRYLAVLYEDHWQVYQCDPDRFLPIARGPVPEPFRNTWIQTISVQAQPSKQAR